MRLGTVETNPRDLPAKACFDALAAELRAMAEIGALSEAAAPAVKRRRVGRR